MALNTTADNAVDPVATGLWYERSNRPDRYVGLMAAPPREIEGISGQFAIASEFDRLNEDQDDSPYGGTQAWRNRTHPMSKAQEPREVGVGTSTDSVTLERYAEKCTIYDVDRTHMLAAHGFDLEQPALRRLFHVSRGIHERKVGSFLTTTANFATTADPGDIGTVSTSLVASIYTAIRTIEDGIGEPPNMLACNLQIAHEWSLLNDVRNSLPLGSESQIAPFSALEAYCRQMFECQLVVFRGNFEDNSGSAASFFNDDHIAVYFASDVPGAPSFVNTVTNSAVGTGMQLGPNTTGVKQLRSQYDDASVFVADQWFKLKQGTGMSAAGYLLTDVSTA